MVCSQTEGNMTVCNLVDSLQSEKKYSTIEIKPDTSVQSLFDHVVEQYLYNPNEFNLTFQSQNETYIDLHPHRDKTIKELGIMCLPEDRNQIIIHSVKNNKNIFCECVNEDDLHLGASASPTTGGDMLMPISTCDPQPSSINDCESYEGNSSGNLPVTSMALNYVGLVNQAMTCYLNSLLQALYMTPEFRNALYNWEFDGQNEHRSIPYQLQKLFLNLQTSTKSAVETTDLTTSFGWQGSDAWHQHDIQELCRVMFDALEQKFKDTKQANLINDLYEGKMLDYVKCLECGTESSREDTFQDIPLPVRPFGSTVAYNSVEEALRAFVQPETLDGTNQYHCEKCNKKCDAHKGLKFTKFPYLLTLHLKRFDFDYNTMHRIKLNDKVVFPEFLNLNSFIPVPKHEHNSTEERESVSKCDDCSTTDSGSADDESCQGTDVSSTVNGPDDNCADSDEGIDVSSGSHLEPEPKGPYMYELFSIMIHSGSASGGHYYAYIKDFDKNRWFCFNDQTVSDITEDDIRKTYGGGPHRGYYSGAYSSSTNAYMLMYRQIDKERNCRAIDVDSFPPHIKNLLIYMREKEEEDRIIREKENDMIKLFVYCRHPETDVLEDVKINMFTDSTLKDAAIQAHQRFKLNGHVSQNDCRIVMYNKTHDCIHCSFDNDEIKFCDIISKNNMMLTAWMLDYKDPLENFKVYKSGGINIKVYTIIWETEDVEEPFYIRVDEDDTAKTLKEKISLRLRLEVKNMKVALYLECQGPQFLEKDDEIVNFDAKYLDYKLFVTIVNDDEDPVAQRAKFNRIVEKFGSLLTLYLVLPNNDLEVLEELSIPSLDLNQNLDKLLLTNGEAESNSPNLRVSPQPGVGMSGDGFGDQSNSEDSSLSDSDRTLVGDAPGEGLGLLSSSSNSPADQHMASPSDPAEDNYNFDVFNNPSEIAQPTEEMNWDDEETQHAQKFDNQEYKKAQNYFFKLATIVYEDTSKHCYYKCVRVLVDKRMTLKRFKQHLELIIRVPAEYFKVFRQYGSTQDEWSFLTDTLVTLKDNERLTIKLGRVLRKDEYNTKIYLLNLETCEPNQYLIDHIIAKGQTVAQIKKEILIQLKKKHMVDIPFSKCRLREKSWKKPRKVYTDNEKAGDDITMTNNMDLYLQEIPEGEIVTPSTQIVLFIRQWCPSTLKLERIGEIALDNTSIEELKNAISKVSNIPVEHVDFAHVKSAFPCDMHVLEITEELSWNPNVTNLEQWPISADDGSVFFYRDNRETLKELTPEEKKEINQKENTRLGRHSTKSPGREKALKIYLDCSPSKLEDNCID